METKRKKGRPATGRKLPANVTVAMPAALKAALEILAPRKKNKLIIDLLEAHLRTQKSVLKSMVKANGSELDNYLLKLIGNE